WLGPTAALRRENAPAGLVARQRVIRGEGRAGAGRSPSRTVAEPVFGELAGRKQVHQAKAGRRAASLNGQARRPHESAGAGSVRPPKPWWFGMGAGLQARRRADANSVTSENGWRLPVAPPEATQCASAEAKVAPGRLRRRKGPSPSRGQPGGK